MEGSGSVERLRRLANVTAEVGILQLQPCSEKVERLHLELSRSTNGGGPSHEAVRLIASILLDGKDCNQELMQHITCRTPLPELPFYRGFRLVTSGNNELSRSLVDEQGLVLWMLARINPDRLLLSPDALEQTPPAQDYRDLLVRDWQYLIPMRRH